MQPRCGGHIGRCRDVIPAGTAAAVNYQIFGSITPLWSGRLHRALTILEVKTVRPGERLLQSECRPPASACRDEVSFEVRALRRPLARHCIPHYCRPAEGKIDLLGDQRMDRTRRRRSRRSALPPKLQPLPESMRVPSSLPFTCAISASFFVSHTLRSAPREKLDKLFAAEHRVLESTLREAGSSCPEVIRE